MTRTFYAPKNVGPVQIDLPEFKVKGRKGALHIRPSSTLSLSDDEVKFLSTNKKTKELFLKLRETTPKKSGVYKPVVRPPAGNELFVGSNLTDVKDEQKTGGTLEEGKKKASTVQKKKSE